MSSALPELERKMTAPWAKSAAWVRFTAAGALELELYDYSPQAQSSLGGDVAWIWRVSATEISRLYQLLAERHGQPSSHSEVLDVLATWPNVHALRDWLRAERFSVAEEFDGSA